MQTHIWAKTLLSSYRFLERIAGAIDKTIEKKALSQNITGQPQLGASTLNLAEQIIDLSQRKIKLINIKVLIENSLKAMENQDARMLIKRYIEKNSIQDVTTQFDMAKRTYFRKIAFAEAAFIAQCAKQGYGCAKLDEYLADENIIMEIKRVIEKSEIKDHPH